MLKAAFSVIFFVSFCSAGSFDRDWKVFLVPYSHIDVGFTAPVDEVIQQHMQYLDYIVEQFEDNEPGDGSNSFRWTIEITWILDAYISNRPHGQVDKLMSLIREGYIELGAMHFGLQTDLTGPEELIRSLYYAKELQNVYDIPVRTAMINDTPGFTWSLAQILPASGIPYLSVAMNSVLSEFYQTTSLPYLFYWRAQNGDRTLVWRSIDTEWAYLEGIITYQVYGFYASMRDRITALLHALEASGYPYDAVMINCATGDNGAPLTEIVGNVATWNENHDDAELIISTISGFFEYAESVFGIDIPEFAGDAPNWWSWLFASSASKGFESTRSAQLSLPAAEALSSMADVTGNGFAYPALGLRRAYIDNLLYEDHNMGANYPSGNIPFWGLKTGWVENALHTGRSEGELALDFIAGNIHTDEFPAIVVVNDQGWERSDAVFLPADDAVIASSGQFFITDPQTGDTLDVQYTNDGLIAFQAAGIPAFGYKIFHIVPGNGPIPGHTPLGDYSISNDFYRLEVDAVSGSLTGLTDLEYDREYTRQDGNFNRYLYNGNQTPAGMQITGSDSGAVFQRLILRGSAPGSLWLETTITLYNLSKRIDFRNTYEKSLPASLESVDFLFHSNIPAPELRYEIPFGHVRLFEDELSGFRTNHYAMQRWMHVGAGAGNGNLLLATGSVAIQAYPAGQFDGAIRLLSAFNSTGTAYRAGVGEHTVFFSMTTGEAEFDPADAMRFAYSALNPLHARTLPAYRSGTESSIFSMVRTDPPDLFISTVKRSMTGHDHIVRLYNPSSEPATFDMEFGPELIAAFETTPLEDNISPLAVNESRVNLTLDGYGIMTVRAVLNIALNAAHDRGIPPDFFLYQNFPNPFNPSTNIRYRLDRESDVSIIVYNVLGQRVAVLTNERRLAGEHVISWNGRMLSGRSAPSGVYYYSLEIAGSDGTFRRETKPMILMR